MEEGTRLDEKYGYLFQQIVSVARAENKIDEHTFFSKSSTTNEQHSSCK